MRDSGLFGGSERGIRGRLFFDDELRSYHIRTCCDFLPLSEGLLDPVNKAQLPDGSVSLSPLDPNLRINLHVGTAASLHHSFRLCLPVFESVIDRETHGKDALGVKV